MPTYDLKQKADYGYLLIDPLHNSEEPMAVVGSGSSCERNETMLNYKRYRRFPAFRYPERTWVDKEIVEAPVWCSVDLRDGNQALVDPMSVEEKIEFFQMLVKLGFKEIEVGFPAASQIEYDFLRQLIERKMIPDDVTVQVLVQCRAELLERTFECLAGLDKAIVHIYNSTSILQRDVVFGKSKQEIIDIALTGTQLVKKYAKDFPGNIRLEYSPESFTGTEMDFAEEICNAVLDAWECGKGREVIINLPSTVEMNTPNVYADQIEYMCNHLKYREHVIVSVHPHNDRGEGIASTELALLAGADRVEGTLFGNGERTGNVDILTVAYNMFSHGVDPKLNIEDINPIKEVYERCTKMSIHPRAPYAGELVFTAFSGSHQDAINKGVKAMKDRNSEIWEVPYLPIDPADIGRKYEPIVRINSQSGKGGVAFIMDSQFGYKLPKGMQREFADYIQFVSEQEGEVSPQEIFDIFDACYVQTKEPIHFKNIRTTDTENEGDDSFTTLANVTYMNRGEMKNFGGVGNGPIDAVLTGLNHEIGIKAKVIDYQEHALGSGTNVKAVSYIHLLDIETGKTSYGVGLSSNITRSSIRALFSAVNRLYFKDIAEDAGKKRVEQRKLSGEKPKGLFGNS